MYNDSCNTRKRAMWTVSRIFGVTMNSRIFFSMKTLKQWFSVVYNNPTSAKKLLLCLASDG